MDKKTRIFGGVCAFLLVMGMFFVMAAIDAPTAVIIKQNVTPVYDEGSFVINWTAPASGGELNYSIFIYADDVLYTVAGNDSLVGYEFSNTSVGDGNITYSFTIQAENATDQANSSTNVSMTVDRTAPVITMPQYTNGTWRRNAQTLTLNISVSDASSGTTGTLCTVNVNGTNQTIALSGSWCVIPAMWI